ncbi:MAG: acyl-ACP--UDP-N-acetylglucosamine O-acyltransferase [Prevotella sp.]|nr:acyl-ACP--UDP-N-acetylglucosamine O-acyltransferase [Candidatus Prevotella equi]
MSNISDKAYIDPKAKLGNNVTVMPFAYIEGDVEIGDDCVIYPHVSIMNGTKMGKGNTVFQGTVLGAVPQDFNYCGRPTKLIIGDKNIFRENVVIARSSYDTDGSATTIGNENFFMEGVHISHDNHIGNANVFGYGTKLAGDITVEDHVIFSSSIITNAGCRVGRYSMIVANSYFSKDVPPYIIASGDPIEFCGVNKPILQRSGVDEKTINHVANAYRLVFNGQNDIMDVCNQIVQQVPPGEEIDNIITFLSTSKLGLITKL